jgi:hypothetical protein
MAKVSAWKIALVAWFAVFGSRGVAEAEGPASTDAAATILRGGEDAEPTFDQGAMAWTAGPIARQEAAASPSRPTWTGGASTSDQGELQTDFGWQWQSMGMGIGQMVLPSSVRYGVTSRLELRWGLPAHMIESGGRMAPLKGISDQYLSALFRFHEQGRWMPALAFDYGIKIPSANPAKGFGTGYIDHQLVFVASRDVGRAHFDFNVVGTVAGAPYGNDGAAQYGLALSLPLSSRLTWVLDSYGGPQPGTADRYGAVLSGGTWALRPWLVVDAAYTRAYTTGTPRQQVTVGLTHAIKPGFRSAFKSARVARLLHK